MYHFMEVLFQNAILTSEYFYNCQIYGVGNTRLKKEVNISYTS